MIKRQSFFNIIIAYTGLGFSFFNTLLKTKILTPEEIGILSLILTFSGILYYFVVMGIPSIILKFFPEHKKNESEKNGFILYSFGTVIILFISIVLLMAVLKNTLLGNIIDLKLKPYYMFIFLFLFIESFFQVGDSVLRAMLKTVYPSFLKNFANNILHFGLILFILFTGRDFLFYLRLYIIIKSVTLIILLIIILNNTPPVKPTFGFVNRKELKKYYKYGLIMIISIFAMTLVYRIDRIFLMKLSTIKNIGIYSIAVIIGSVIRMVGVSVNRIVHPKISHLIHNNQMNQLEKLYKNSVLINLIFGIFLFSILLFFSENILYLLGEAYLLGSLVLIIIASGEFINISAGMCGGIIVFSHLYKFDLILNILLLVLNIIMNFVFIPIWGINGAALASALSVAVYNIIKLIIVYSKYSIHPFSKRYIAMMLKGFVLVAVLFVISSYFDMNQPIYLIMGIIIALIIHLLLNLRYIKDVVRSFSK